MIKINSEQTAYNIGYDNPALPYRGNFLSPHMVISNAYYCGQADAQNHAPRASDFRLDDYDFPSCERKSSVPVAPDARSLIDEHKNSEREIASLQYRLEEAEGHLARLSVQGFPEDVMQVAAQACRDADYSPTNFDGTPSIVCKAVARAVLAERQKWSALSPQPLSVPSALPRLSVQKTVGWYRDPKKWVFHLSLGKDKPANGSSNPDEWQPIVSPTVEGKVSVPDGWKLVPIEPTDAMKTAGAGDGFDIYWGYEADGRPGGPEDVYRAMLVAVPTVGGTE